MKRTMWIIVQQPLPKRKSKSWELNRKTLAHEPLKPIC